jgi:hypothetical protein
VTKQQVEQQEIGIRFGSEPDINFWTSLDPPKIPGIKVQKFMRLFS